MEFVSFEQAVEIWDTLRKPVNAKERQSRIEGKDIGELYPYYGATGQVGYIDGYISDGEYVLLGEDGAPFLQPTATKAYLIHGKAWVNNHAHVLRSKYNNAFLCYYLNSFDYQGFVSGTTRLKLTQAAMKQIPIPAPPLSEQKHIVSRIEELFSQLDASVAELKTAKERLRVYRQAVLKEAFEKVKVHIPFGKIIDARLGKMLDKEKNTGNYRKYLRNINVRWFSFDLSDLLEMRIEDDEIEKYSVSHNDLIICEGGEPGRCAVWDKHDSIFYQKALHRVRFLDNSNPKFYMYYLWFSAQTGQLCRYFTGTGIKHLTGQSLSKVVVPKTDRPTQDSIVAEIESRLSVCDSIEKTVETALLQAKALQQSILKKAFEGRLL
jgi:type I restriction enzyme S subunit